MISGLHFFVDVLDLAIKSNNVSPALWKRAASIDDTEFFSDLLFRITKNRVVQIKLLCKSRIVFDTVTTGCEVGDVVFTNRFAVRTERQTFFGSATGESFGVPGNNHSFLSLQLRHFVGFAVASL